MGAGGRGKRPRWGRERWAGQRAAPSWFSSRIEGCGPGPCRSRCMEGKCPQSQVLSANYVLGAVHIPSCALLRDRAYFTEREIEVQTDTHLLQVIQLGHGKAGICT